MAKPWPSVVYLETTILKQLPRDFGKPEFSLLESLCKILKLRIVTTQLCLDELIHERKSELQRVITRIRTDVSKVKPYLPSVPDLSWLDEAACLNELERRTIDVFGKRGIGILADVAVDQRRLKEMAIRKIPPFTPDGKGFKDAIITFTIIDHERRLQAGGEYGLMLSDDAAIRHAFATVPECTGLEIVVVSSLTDANDRLKGSLKRTFREAYDKRAGILLRFLNDNRDAIEAFIRKEATFSPWSLTVPGMVVEDIASIDVIEILPPVSDTLWDPPNERTIKIGFSAKVGLVLLVVPSQWPVRRLKLRGEELPQEPIFYTEGPAGLFSPRKQTQVSIERLISIQATVDLRIVDDQEVYSNLILENIHTNETPLSVALREQAP